MSDIETRYKDLLDKINNVGESFKKELATLKEMYKEFNNVKWDNDEAPEVSEGASGKTRLTGYAVLYLREYVVCWQQELDKTVRMLTELNAAHPNAITPPYTLVYIRELY